MSTHSVYAFLTCWTLSDVDSFWIYIVNLSFPCKGLSISYFSFQLPLFFSAHLLITAKVTCIWNVHLRQGQSFLQINLQCLKRNLTSLLHWLSWKAKTKNLHACRYLSKSNKPAWASSATKHIQAFPHPLLLILILTQFLPDGAKVEPCRENVSSWKLNISFTDFSLISTPAQLSIQLLNVWATTTGRSAKKKAKLHFWGVGASGVEETPF